MQTALCRALPPALAASAVALTAAVAPAAPTVLTQARSVVYTIPDTGDPADPDNGASGTLAAPDFAPFDELIGETAEQGAERNSAFAFQRSSFGPPAAGDADLVAAAAGSARYIATGTPDIISAGSSFEITFRLDEPTDFAATSGGFYTNSTGGASGFSLSLDGPGGLVFAHAASGADGSPDPSVPDNDGSVISLDFADSGLLGVGTYTLAARASVGGGTNFSEVNGGYSLELALTGVGGEDMNPLIPLPAGGWAGLAVLGGLAVPAAIRSRRRAATA